MHEAEPTFQSLNSPRINCKGVSNQNDDDGDMFVNVSWPSGLAPGIQVLMFKSAEWERFGSLSWNLFINMVIELFIYSGCEAKDSL